MHNSFNHETTTRVSFNCQQTKKNKMGNCIRACGPSTIVTEENIVDDIKSTFQFVETLGKGFSGTVVKSKLLYQDKSEECQRLEGRNIVALKCMAKHSSNKKDFEQEVSILKQLNHKNIIKYIDCYMDTKMYYIATAFCCGGDLIDRINQQTQECTCTEAVASNWIRQMLLSVEYCHKKNIAHRDLKPENFVFQSKSDDSLLKLIDFAWAKEVIPDRVLRGSDCVGTPHYMAPEIILCASGKQTMEKILKAADIWSIGIICFVLLNGAIPFDGKCTQDVFDKVVNAKYIKFYEDTSDSLKDFIFKLLHRNPEQCLTAEEAL